jgi:phosphoglycerate dehydrogenase-like enzyme
MERLRRDRRMSLTIWTNHNFRPEVLKEFQEGIEQAGHRLVISPKASASVLAAGGTDPVLDQADVAYGQPDVIQAMGSSRLKFVALTTAGYARYDRDDFRAAMKTRGIPVTNASQVFADPCAQHVLAQMLALLRNLPTQLRNQDGPREWRYLEDRFSNGVLTGCHVLLLGYGAIGRRLAELLQPFGARVTAYRRTRRGDEGIGIVDEAGLTAALASTDHVVNLLPDSPATTGWMNAARFSQMKPGARFYNIGRGTTVDQAALMAALESGQVGAAYLDVMDPEPLPPAHPLWEAKNCLITCHIGGGTREQDRNLARHFLANLTAFARGGALVDRIM